jgi:hypothetical protein
MEHKIADIGRDSLLLEDVKTWDKRMSDQYPDNIKPLIDRWLSVNQQYGNV